MGLIRNIVKLSIIVLVGLLAMGFLGYGPFEETLDKWLHPSQESLMERAQKIRNFDPKTLDPEFELEKVGGILDDHNTLVAKHLPTGQKMFVAESKDLITKQDLMNANSEKLGALFGEVKSLGVAPDGIEVTKTGLMNVRGDEIPFVEFSGKSTGLAPVPISGMITEKDGQILASTNEQGKWSHFPDDGFFGNTGRPARSSSGLPCVCD